MIGKLGRLPHDSVAVARCIQAHDILNLSTIPSLPAAFDWSQKDGADLTYGMFGNDLYGDCVFASACHQILTWSGQTDVEEAIAEADALDAYRRFTGFDPVTGANDEGAVMLDVAKRWAKGEKIAGHVLKAFVAVDQTRLALVDAVCTLFGGIWTGGRA